MHISEQSTKRIGLNKLLKRYELDINVQKDVMHENFEANPRYWNRRSVN